MDFSHSPRAQALMERLREFMRDEIAPAEAVYAASLRGGSDWRQWQQPPVMETLKAKARAGNGKNPSATPSIVAQAYPETTRMALECCRCGGTGSRGSWRAGSKQLPTAAAVFIMRT